MLDVTVSVRQKRFSIPIMLVSVVKNFFLSQKRCEMIQAEIKINFRNPKLCRI